MSRRESDPDHAGSPTGRWRGRAVVACASLAALAGTVAAVATAAGADGEQAERSEATAREEALRAADVPPQPTPVPAADTAAAAPRLAAAPVPPGRAGAPSLGATVQVLPGWEAGGSQDLVPVPPDRFPTVVTLADRAAVLVGRLDPARGFGPDALADEAHRLVGAFADGAMRRAPGERGRIADVSDGAGTLDGRDAHTVVRRVTTGDGRPGPLVRVTTVAGERGEPGLVVLAVAGPGSRQGADATAADRVVRSLSSAPADAPPPAGRAAAPPASAAPGLPPRPAVSRAPVAGPPSSRPVSRPPARPAPPTPPTDR